MNAPTSKLNYTPDYAAPPGKLIQEYLEALDISARELARRCGRSGKLVAEIVSGKAPVEPGTALQLERVLGLPATVWMNMEAAYQLNAARQAERRDLAVSYDWAKSFPLKELADRSLISREADRASQVQDLLSFFGVGSVKACEERIQDLLAVDYRTSPTYSNSIESLAAWLRIGEREALECDAADYNRDQFLVVLKEIRDLTSLTLDTTLPTIKQKCAEAGVVFVLEQPLSKVRVSGISRWLSPRKALIQQTFRYKSDDHFWFTFFHECAHLLLHSRKSIFIDMAKGPGSADPKQEAEANVWASEFLIPHKAMKKFLSGFTGDEDEVVRFAAECGVAPGIVIGQLQHRKAIGFNALNHLKVRYEFTPA